MLTFDHERHEYRHAGVLVPGVTSLLQHLHSFAGVPLDVLQAAQERGTAVHAACQFFDEEDLDEEQLQASSPMVFGYLCGWKKFMAERAPTWNAIEQPVYHPTLRYAGTPDRFGVLGGEDWQVDIKTSQQSHPVWGVQTAAYNQAAGKPKARRATVQLRADGTYRFIEWKDPTDWPVFVSLVTLHHWKGNRP